MAENQLKLHIVDDDLGMLDHIFTLLECDNEDDFADVLRTFPNSDSVQSHEYMMYIPAEWSLHDDHIYGESLLGWEADDVGIGWIKLISGISHSTVAYSSVAGDEDYAELVLTAFRGEIVERDGKPLKNATSEEKGILNELLQQRANKDADTLKQKETQNKAPNKKRQQSKYATLQDAVYAKDYDYIESKLTKRGLYVKRSFDSNPESIFMYALRKGQNELIDILLAKGYDVHRREPHNHLTILHWACSQHFNKENLGTQVARLVNLGIDPNLLAGKDSLLLKATKNNNIVAMKSLCALAADPNIGDSRDLTPLFKVQSLESLNILIEANADLTHLDVFGQTALFESVRYQRIEIVERMIKLGMDVNHQAKDGSTALFGCCFSHHSEVARIILKHGADLTVKNNEDLRAYELEFSSELRQMLESEGYI